MNQHQKKLDEWFKEKKWPYWSNNDILLQIYEEVSELSKEVRNNSGLKKKKNNEKTSSIKEELGDILFALTCFANSNKIDMDECFEESLNKIKKRDKDRFPKKTLK